MSTSRGIYLLFDENEDDTKIWYH